MQRPQVTKTELLGFLFYLAAALSIIFVKTPAPPAFQKSLYEALLAGKDPFNPVGSQFAVFKALLPPHEKVGFIMDFPFSPYLTKIEQLYSAQSYLTPQILTYETTPRSAIVYCTNTSIAQYRLAQTGYRILLPVAEGKGIAVKK